MILLLGGTSETGDIARRLAQAGHAVLVSTATDEPLAIGELPGIRRRVGRLDADAMADLIREQNITAIVDATHPYAAVVRAIAPAAARQAGIPYFAFLRAGTVDPADPACRLAAGHEQAAEIACSLGRCVLLTTGSNNLACYVRQADRAGVALVARVLPRADSIAACLAAGLARDSIIAAKGPFTVEQNREHIRRFKVGVLVTKDSGQAGGVDAKLAAARLEGCQVVVVRRPATPPQLAAHATIAGLVAAVIGSLPHP